MSGKPDDIPQDVWGAALELQTPSTAFVRFMSVKATEIVARAILAERERCAAIPDAEHGNAFNDSGRHIAGRIAAAIRKGGEA